MQVLPSCSTRNPSITNNEQANAVPSTSNADNAANTSSRSGPNKRTTDISQANSAISIDSDSGPFGKKTNLRQS